MPYLFLEQSAKMLWIFKPKFVGNFTDRFVGVEYPRLGYFYQFVFVKGCKYQGAAI